MKYKNDNFFNFWALFLKMHVFPTIAYPINLNSVYLYIATVPVITGKVCFSCFHGDHC